MEELVEFARGGDKVTPMDPRQVKLEQGKRYGKCIAIVVPFPEKLQGTVDTVWLKEGLLYWKWLNETIFPMMKKLCEQDKSVYFDSEVMDAKTLHGLGTNDFFQYGIDHCKDEKTIQYA